MARRRQNSILSMAKPIVFASREGVT